MNNNTIGRMVRGKTRAPKSYPVGRVCANQECGVKLNRYNRREYCYNHTPIRYPRIRGRVLPDNA